MRNTELWHDNQNRLDAVWRRIEAAGGRPEVYPIETSSAFYLLMSLEYNIDRKILERLIARGDFIAPQKQFGRMAWTESDILRLAEILDHRRSFLPFSGRRTEVEREISTRHYRQELGFAPDSILAVQSIGIIEVEDGCEVDDT